ncbi:inversin-B-like [Acanthaster planci]|uniref:Inversin-B-like n=1 Tax=Acanthaster planci TaxID=133434 RepID=A0A8B7YEG8_ACAPL|nr:inversin-B-like [Acanthaster planci]XP_022091649.1 inversin-B-like [Acanthaster planci]
MFSTFGFLGRRTSMEFANSPHSSSRTEEQDRDSLETEDGSQMMAHQAAATGNVPLLMEAVNHDPSALESQDEKGMTPLSRAVINKQLDMVKLLVKMGADINIQDALGRTPLCLAAYEGWYHGVIYLLRSGGKQAIADTSGRLPLHAATHDKDSRTLSALLQTLTIGDVNEPDNDGMTALHWAAFHNRPEHVQLLMLRGGDLYSVDVDGKTPLHWASQNGCLACCSIMAKCRSGGAPLINMLEGSGKSCVHLAAAAGYSNILEEFVDVPVVDFEVLDPDDRTPLHWAAASVQLECVEILLQLGIDPSPHDVNGGTPLDYAKQTGNQEVIRILQRAGAQFGTIASVSSRASQDGDKIGEGDRKEPWKKRFGFISEWFNRRKNGLRYKSPSEESDGPNGTKEWTVVAKATSDHPNYAVRYSEADCHSDHIAGSSEEDLSEEALHRDVVGRMRSVPHGSQEDLQDTTLSKRSMSEDLSYTRRNSFPVNGDGLTADTIDTCRSSRRGSDNILRAVSPMHVDNIQLKGNIPDKHNLLPTVSPLPSSVLIKGPGSSNEEVLSLGEVSVPLRPLCRDLPDADTVQRHAQEILDAQRSESWLSSSNSGSRKPIPSLCGRSLSQKNLYISSVPKLAPLTSRPPVSPGTGESFFSLSPQRTTATSPSLLLPSDMQSSSMPSHYLPFKQRSLSISSDAKYGSCPTINQKGLASKTSNLKSSRLEALQPIQPHDTEKSEKKKKRKKPKPLTAAKFQDNIDSADLTRPASAEPAKSHQFSQSLSTTLEVATASVNSIIKS